METSRSLSGCAATRPVVGLKNIRTVPPAAACASRSERAGSTGNGTRRGGSSIMNAACADIMVSGAFFVRVSSGSIAGC